MKSQEEHWPLSAVLLVPGGFFLFTSRFFSAWGPEIAIWCVDLALVFYALAVAKMSITPHSLWIDCPRTRSIRLYWTLGCLMYWLHWLLAFHYFHDWSHEQAVSHTRARSGYGFGILFSHLFTLIWTMDVVAWWLVPARYLRRPIWLGTVVHGYLAFIVFQSTVVFATGIVRWCAVLASLLLIAFHLLARWRAWKCQEKSPADSNGTGRAT